MEMLIWALFSVIGLPRPHLPVKVASSSSPLREAMGFYLCCVPRALVGRDAEKRGALAHELILKSASVRRLQEALPQREAGAGSRVFLENGFVPSTSL